MREDEDPVYVRLEKLDKEQKARLDDVRQAEFSCTYCYFPISQMARHANEDSAAELTFQPKITYYPLDNRVILCVRLGSLARDLNQKNLY